jgi:hypothetical protein
LRKPACGWRRHAGAFTGSSARAARMGSRLGSLGCIIRGTVGKLHVHLHPQERSVRALLSLQRLGKYSGNKLRCVHDASLCLFEKVLSVSYGLYFRPCNSSLGKPELTKSKCAF